MSKILYIIDHDETKNYEYHIEEDTTIYHFSINSTVHVNITLDAPGVCLSYYYSNINYDDSSFSIEVLHRASNTHSEVVNHGVNVHQNKLAYYIDGVVLKESKQCICNQENQIMNLQDGKSTICPNLLIDNYDVDSNHSAYIGKFRDETLFYLMSRGISHRVAYRLLLQGFLIPECDRKKEEVVLFLREIEKI